MKTCTSCKWQYAKYEFKCESCHPERRTNFEIDPEIAMEDKHEFDLEEARVLYEEFKEKTPNHSTMLANRFWFEYRMWLEEELLKARRQLNGK